MDLRDWDRPRPSESDSQRWQDLKTARLARQRLRDSAYPDLRQVECECDKGVLVLRGRVSSYFHKQLAQEAVHGLRGNGGFVNRIEVVAPRQPSQGGKPCWS